MQITAENFRLFSKLIEQSNDVLILLDKDQSADSVAVALFFENFLSTKGKKMQIVAKSKLPENLSYLKDKITDKIEPPKLVVSFNWHETAVDKVTYDLEGENFNFIVTPKDKKIKPEDINFSYRGKEVDLVITLGLSNLSLLEEYEREYIQRKTLVNIDNSSENQMFGSVNIVDEAADALCAIIADVAEKSDLSLSTDQAEVLLSGLRQATANFTQVKNARTFEVAAYYTKVKKGELKNKMFTESKNTQVPNDWLSPKVFRSNREAS